MKIALVRKYYTDFGGAERYTAAMAEHLLDAGHEVHVFANEWKVGKEGTGSGRIVFHRVPMLKGLSVLEVLSFALNSRRMLKKERFDIIHSFEKTVYQDVYRAGDGCHREWLIQRRKIDPLYKTIINRINPLHLVLLQIERKIFRKGNFKTIIAISKRGKEEIAKHYEVSRKKIKVIYNAIDANRFDLDDRTKKRAKVRKAIGIPEDAPLLIFVGSGFRRKGLPAAIRALARLDSRVSLMVVGRDRAGPYRSLAKKEGVENRVFFMGPVVDVERYYCASDLFVFPTVYEPFGNVCLEAMAAGLPVITSRICGGSEVLDEGKNGYVVENPTDPSEIAEKVGLGLALDRLSVQARNRELLNNFTWEEQLLKITDIYAAVAGGDTYYE
jgi:UDP-glucose:(heptosyl)LPS alpha-1,3-glucosyltransferase